MSLATRIAERQGLPRAAEPICGDTGFRGTDLCVARPHSVEDELHRDAAGRTWGARTAEPRWLQLARQRPLGLARDETGRSAL